MIRIFSYLPNPRVWKALIAAEIGAVAVEVVGDKPANLAEWLWDYDARPLSAAERTSEHPDARQASRGFGGYLYKTDAFLVAHPFGTVPAAFAAEGTVGIFESNSILRAVARAAASADPSNDLYGGDEFTASRIDSFLDANLVFAREAQVYLLAMDNMHPEIYTRMEQAYAFYLDGVERALNATPFLAGAALSIADISFVCDFAQFLREGHYGEQLAAHDLAPMSRDGLQMYPKAFGHMLTLSATPPFAKHMGSYLNWFRRAHELA